MENTLLAEPAHNATGPEIAAATSGFSVVPTERTNPAPQPLTAATFKVPVVPEAFH